MSKKTKKDKCEVCKEELAFRMHECKRSIAEYYGCTKCDNWCIHCKKKKLD